MGLSIGYPWAVEELGRHAKGVVDRNVLIVGLLSSQLSISF